MGACPETRYVVAKQRRRACGRGRRISPMDRAPDPRSKGTGATWHSARTGDRPAFTARGGGLASTADRGRYAPGGRTLGRATGPAAPTTSSAAAHIGRDDRKGPD